ncbi:MULTISPECIES: hypothetical protein [unclassified Streptomyces]|uniref:hypothetical protein n=1 Tax=unclassified Streptomyces TaxID=2593676 RepID=UPI0021D8B542|nr:hypothetical protein [Streptomyces sp. A13(2022)]MCU8595848.1 hypothetical protein [Streptomyces sp. A13(2022)]
MPKKIEHLPAGKFMTLDEIAQFVADAYAAGASGSDIPTGRLSFGGKLQQLVVAVEHE